MSKELTPLEAWKIIKSLEVLINEDCDSTLVEDLPESKVIDTALIGYLVYKQDYERVMREKNSLLKEYVKSQKELKALEIIKNKRVNVGNFIYWLKRKPRTYKDYLQDYYQEQWYLHYRDNNDGRCKFYKLTQEEYDLLKEVIIHDR